MASRNLTTSYAANDRETAATDIVFETLGYQDTDLEDMFRHNDPTADSCDVEAALRYLDSLAG